MPASTTREDPHRVAVLDPADYRLAAFEDMHDEEGMIEVNLDGVHDLARTFWHRENIGGVSVVTASRSYTESDIFAFLMDRVENPNYGCRLCGQAHGNRYWYYFEHQPTGDVIRVGSKCAAACRLASREELEDRRTYERRDMAVERGHRLAGDPAARWAIEWCWRQVEDIAVPGKTGGLNLGPGFDGQNWSQRFACDLLTRFNREATLSDKQVALCRKLDAEGDQRRERAERIEREKAEAKPIAADVLAGRATITGKVLSVKWRDDAYGGKFVTTIADDRGFKVWGTATDPLLEAMYPQAGAGIVHGESQAAFIADRIRHDAEIRVTFQAAVTASDDETFGFFKRPTKVGAA